MNEELLKIDICSRLPYGVKAVTRLNPIPSIVRGIYPGGKYFLGDDRKAVFYPIQPVLFPISCLAKEIQFRGEKIIPLIELVKIDGHLQKVTKVKCDSDCLYIASGEIYGAKVAFVYDSEDSCFFIDNSGYSSPYDDVGTLKFYDWLNSHMIDYRGLIDKGLAKSVFDLKENPYE